MSFEHRILITGANGFVGRWLQEELNRRGKDHNITVIGAGQAIDIVNGEQVAALIKSVEPSAVVHLAAIAAPLEANKAPRRAWEVNFSGTMNLANALLEVGKKARLIFVGSSEAYGNSFNGYENLPIEEGAALKPMTIYGATKAAADIFVGQLAYQGLRAIRFRPFNHTGPGQLASYVVPAFAKQIAEISSGMRPPVIEVGNLMAYRDFLDVRDVVTAYADAAMDENSAGDGEVFNLCSGTPIQIKILLDMLVELSGLEVEIRVDAGRLRASEIPYAHGSGEAALKTLGWAPKYPLQVTLQDVLDDWKTRISAD